MYSKNARANINTLATAYAKATGLSIGVISKRFYGGASMIPDFINGERSVSVKILDEMIGKFRAEWPVGAPWPRLKRTTIPKYRARRIAKPGQIT